MNARDEPIADFLTLGRRQLRRALAAGHPIDPTALDDSRYLGISLGLPGIVDRLLWKTFEKTFHRDPATGALRGWNVRLEQTGWVDPPIPRTRRGAPVTFGHYGVIVPDTPHGAAPGTLLLDYGAGLNPRLDPSRLLRDPLVAVSPGSAALLLGWTYLALGPLKLSTPSYFLLRRLGPLDRVV